MRGELVRAADSEKCKIPCNPGVAKNLFLCRFSTTIASVSQS